MALHDISDFSSMIINFCLQSLQPLFIYLLEFWDLDRQHMHSIWMFSTELVNTVYYFVNFHFVGGENRGLAWLRYLSPIVSYVINAFSFVELDLICAN